MRNRFCRCVLFIFLALTVSVSHGKGQYGSIQGFSNKEELLLPVAYAAFASDSSGMIRLELYYQIYNSVLQFQRVEEIIEADYEMSIIVRDEKGNRVGASTQDKKVKVASEQQAKSWSDFRIKQVNFDLPPGTYKVEFTLKDKNYKTIIDRELKVKLHDYANRLPTLSDIELVQDGGPRQKGSESFIKGNLTVVPSVTAEFGGDENTRLMFYLEIYRGSDSKEAVRMETVLRSKAGGMVYRDSSTILLSLPTVCQIREITISDFLPGDYELLVVLRGRRDKKLDARSKELRISWSTEAVLEHDYKTAVEQLAYIGSRADIKKLKNLKNREERKEAFHDFWLKRDPTPGTPQNELKIEFYRRVTIANEKFTIMMREGWRTDRGRIYIQFGEPDQIDDYPVAANRRPYQEWHYFRRGRYRMFTFVDEYDDGDYRLQFPYDGLHQQSEY